MRRFSRFGPSSGFDVRIGQIDLRERVVLWVARPEGAVHRPIIGETG
jgi:hypothetical protein